MKSRKNKSYKEKGAVTIVEATFVFPIMFFVLFFLLFYGNACYVKATVDSAVSRCAVEAAARIADPQLAALEKSGSLPESSNSNSPNYPYRYVTSGYANTVSAAVEKDLKEDIRKTELFFGLMPTDVQCKIQYKNYFVYQTISIDVDYKVNLPIKLLFLEEITAFEFTAHDEAAVSDTSELVRNVNMVGDYLEKWGVMDKIKGLGEKIKNFLG